MMTTPNDFDVNPLDISCKILKGYQCKVQLTDSEKDVLFLGVLVRLVSSYLMALRNVARDPKNEAYTMVAAGKCPKLIQALWKLGEKKTIDLWLNE